ncbi:DNA-binding protein [Methanobrevibacter arboriphilus JCM 13429 = DSM 1125]|uniref:DNA-binding protein n=2 Tax=Methanobrevibacter arboriphilus TaxID=39441 RepID=A0A1V6N572_METAZ|nr:winged helix DNA-binding protein [Methanobrevibacter arboriphilus]OQD59824.1 DNA-binding protein [Methanobrevibacter arboriphilus JCM 13429 = DSM 1125]
MANLIAYVKSGKNRLKVLEILDKQEKLVFASDITDEVGIRVNHMGALLRELTEKGLLNNPNPSNKRQKLYEISEKGKEIVNYFNK